MHTVSFFSFKGGVGRTNLLLNAAYKLAHDGAFVVVADWDLQAPGLTMMEAMAQPPEDDEDTALRGGSGGEEWDGPDVRRGVLDFLDSALDKEGEIPDPRSLARPTRLAHRAREGDGTAAGAFRGDIWFVPAGRFDPSGPGRDYHDQLLRVQSRNLAGWLLQYERQDDVQDPRGILQYFRDRVGGVENPDLDGRAPDYLLIDSRTGMSEIGDLLLAAEFVDRMVVVCGFNDQNLSGLEAVVRDLQQHIPAGELHTRLTLVVSPVPQGEEALKQQRMEKLEALLDGLRRDIGHGELEFRPELHPIPYHPQIALTEAVMVASFPASEPAKAMSAVVEEIKLKKEIIPLRPALQSALAGTGVLDSEPALRGDVPTIPRHPWSRLPRWNWPDPSVTAEQFLPGLGTLDVELLNAISRTPWQSKDQMVQTVKVWSEGKPDDHQLDEFRKILLAEQRRLGDVARRHWRELLWQGVRQLGHWLELWCERDHGDEEAILSAVIEGERDDFLGGWPEIGYFWFCLGFLLAKKSLWSLAESAYRKALALDPGYAGSWNNLGNLLANHLERYEGAESAFRKAAELDPKEVDPWNNLGELLQKQGRFEEAKGVYREAMKIDPEDSDAYVNNAELALVEGDLDRTAKDLNQSRRLLKRDEEKRGHYVLELALALVRDDQERLPGIHQRLLDVNVALAQPSTWNYADLEPFIDRLPEPSQAFLRAWIGAVKQEEGADPEKAYETFKVSS